jgi:hypothetical protein
MYCTPAFNVLHCFSRQKKKKKLLDAIKQDIYNLIWECNRYYISKYFWNILKYYFFKK